MQKAKRKQMLAISLGEKCNTGLKREENQDSVAHGATPYGEMFVVSDGVGGYYGGAEASAIVTSGMYRHMGSLGLSLGPESSVTEAARRVNAEVFAAGQSGDASRRRMSATLAFALLVSQQEQDSFDAFAGNVGDSRIYLLRNGQLTQLSTDHTAVQGMIDSGLLTPDQAVNHPQASVLTRTIGQGPDVAISLRRIPLKATDQLLLCSDGLHAFVSQNAIVAAMTNPQLSASECSHALLDLALAAGGPDNISIQVVRISLAAAPMPTNRPRNPLIWASIAAGVILLASVAAVKLYEIWQLRPAAIVSSAVSTAGKVSKSAGAVLESAANSAKANSEGASDPSLPAVGTRDGRTVSSSSLLIGGILPREGAERTWFRNLETRLGPVTAIEEPRRTPCVLLASDTPVAYYRDEAVREQSPATDNQVENHYLFKPYSQAIRHACGDFDLLLLPAHQPVVPGEVKDRLEAGRDKVKSATHRVADVLTDH